MTTPNATQNLENVSGRSPAKLNYEVFHHSCIFQRIFLKVYQFASKNYGLLYNDCYRCMVLMLSSSVSTWLVIFQFEERFRQRNKTFHKNRLSCNESNQSVNCRPSGGGYGGYAQPGGYSNGYSSGGGGYGAAESGIDPYTAQLLKRANTAYSNTASLLGSGPTGGNMG